MNDPRDAWAAEFEGLGEDYMRDCLHAGLFNEDKRHFAYAWLNAQAKKRSRREKQILRYVQFTLAAAVAALIVGIVGLLLR
jgi:hypothetical protein